jgi:hypothetical protein
MGSQKVRVFDTISIEEQRRQSGKTYSEFLRESSMSAGSEDHRVGPGSLIYVAADVDHRFHDIEVELTVLVFFAPAETT